MNLRKFRASFMMMALALLTALVLGGCGSDGYDTPTQTSTPTSLIEAQTLKSWMDQGLVNNQDGFENVVILEVGKRDSYATVHIPNTYLWDQDQELTMTRLEGLADANTSVASGEMIDPVLQRSGVNRNSTIVITYPAGGQMRAARAYFTLRYWGFPKERVKILNGGNAVWGEAVAANGWDALALTDERPLEHTTNTFSVRKNVNLNDDLRYSIGEMIMAVDSNLDSSTPEINIIQQTDKPRTIQKAIGRTMGMFLDNVNSFKNAEGVQAVLANAGEGEALGIFHEGLPTIVHCASGLSTAPAFFALDGILGWNVALYDGSTNQWNAYMARAEAPTEEPVEPVSGDFATTEEYEAAYATWEEDMKAYEAAVEFSVTANDAWRTDDLSNNPTAYTGTTLIDPDLNWDYQYVDDPRANQIETEDADYMAPASSDGPPTSVEGDSGNC